MTADVTWESVINQDLSTTITIVHKAPPCVWHLLPTANWPRCRTLWRRAPHLKTS